MKNIKQIIIKNRTYYFFNDMINIKDFDSTLIQIDKKSYKNIGMYNIGYITINKIEGYKNINSINPLYLLIGKADGYIEENNGSKYLGFASTDGNKKVLAKFTKFWDEIKHHLETINEGKEKKNMKKMNKIEKVNMKKISWRSNLIQMIISPQIKC